MKCLAIILCLALLAMVGGCVAGEKPATEQPIVNNENALDPLTHRTGPADVANDDSAVLPYSRFYLFGGEQRTMYSRTEYKNGTLTASVDDPTVVEVVVGASFSLVITALKPGECTLTIAFANRTETCVIVVSDTPVHMMSEVEANKLPFTAMRFSAPVYTVPIDSSFSPMLLVDVAFALGDVIEPGSSGGFHGFTTRAWQDYAVTFSHPSRVEVIGDAMVGKEIGSTEMTVVGPSGLTASCTIAVVSELPASTASASPQGEVVELYFAENSYEFQLGSNLSLPVGAKVDYGNGAVDYDYSQPLPPLRFSVGDPSMVWVEPNPNNEPFSCALWTRKPGSCTLTVTDGNGHSASTRIVVTAEPFTPPTLLGYELPTAPAELYPDPPLEVVSLTATQTRHELYLESITRLPLTASVKNGAETAVYRPQAGLAKLDLTVSSSDPTVAIAQLYEPTSALYLETKKAGHCTVTVTAPGGVSVVYDITVSNQRDPAHFSGVTPTPTATAP